MEGSNFTNQIEIFVYLDRVSYPLRSVKNEHVNNTIQIACKFMALLGTWEPDTK